MAKNVSDSMLLERFVSRREEAAFVDLVKRHGPRVEGTCRRLLRNEQDVEDVFQATFLVLARKAAGIPWRDSVGGWLCAVAHRLAMNARVDASRHRRRETPFATLRTAPVLRGRLGDGCPNSTILWPIPLLRSNAANFARCSTTNCSICPKNTGRRWSCATSGSNPPGGRRRARLAVGLDLSPVDAGRGHCCAAGWFTAASSWRPAWPSSVLPHSWPAEHANRDDRDAMTVRQLMISLRPLPEERLRPISNAVATAPMSVRPPSLPRSSPGPAAAAQVATEIETHDPGRNRDEWRNYAGEMRTPAVQLAQTTPGKQPPGHARGRPPAGCQLPEVSRSLSSIRGDRRVRRRVCRPRRPAMTLVHWRACPTKMNVND